MCSYNAINGVPACTNKWLLSDVLRGQWGFEGYMVSDCDGMLYVQKRHKYTSTQVETVAKVRPNLYAPSTSMMPSQPINLNPPPYKSQQSK